MSIEGGGPAPGPWWKRLGWFVLLWLAGVATVSAVAFLIRWWLL